MVCFRSGFLPEKVCRHLFDPRPYESRVRGQDLREAPVDHHLHSSVGDLRERRLASCRGTSYSSIVALV